MGWDCLVEFPTLPNEQPADLRQPNLTCFVQIKSTRTKRHACNVKLSNAVNFAQQAHPCFVVLLVFQDGVIDPTCAYVRHFWEPEIAATLEAARRAHASDIDALNRVAFPIRFSDEERCAPEEMVGRIEAAAQAIGSNYLTAKTSFAQSVGYEEGVGVGSFTFEPGVDPHTYVDLMLGKAGSVPVSEFTFRDRRFGILGPPPPQRPGRTITIAVEPQPFDECLVTIRPTDRSEELTVPGVVYVPGIPNLPEEFRRVRIQADFLEVMLSAEGESRVTATFDSEGPMPIESIGKIATVWSWMEAGALDLEIWVKGQLLAHGVITLDPHPIKGPWKRLHYVLRQLFAFMPPPHWPKTARFALTDMLEGLNALAGFAARISGGVCEVTFGEFAEAHMPALRKCQRFVGPTYLDLGEVTLFAITDAPVVQTSAEDGRVVICLGRPAILRRAVLSGSSAKNWDFMQTQAELSRPVGGEPSHVAYVTLGSSSPEAREG
jgi:hypothetical protein